MQHPEYGGKVVVGERYQVTRMSSRMSKPGHTGWVYRGSRKGLLECRRSYEWACGYGYSKWLESIDSIAENDNDLQIVGNTRVFGRRAQVELTLDRDLVVRRAVFTGRSGTWEYSVETSGTVRPGHSPPVAARGTYRRTHRHPERPDYRQADYEIEFVRLSKRLNDASYQQASRPNWKPHTSDAESHTSM